VGRRAEAKRIVPKTLTLMTEYTDDVGPSGGPYDYQIGYPLGVLVPQKIALCAVATLNDEPAVGVTVTFSISAISTLGWVLDNTTAVTNSQGQAIVQVTSCPLTYPAIGYFKATWISGTAITATHTLGVGIADTPTTPSPTFGAVFSTNPKSIRWKVTSDYRSSYVNGFAAWQFASAGRVAFVENTGDPQYVVTDIDDMNQFYYAITIQIAPPSTIYVKTYNNKYYLDGMPLRDFSPYPPKSVRHHIDSTMAHEIGHALGFGHNTVDRCALMALVVRWFVNATKTPTQDELTSLAILYPVP
ncbi:MAG: hypothetical protein NT023_03290, partial [Armatimonadetes bacterium]|nr:hypothetical protein [Armatimonadota bacterium]